MAVGVTDGRTLSWPFHCRRHRRHCALSFESRKTQSFLPTNSAKINLYFDVFGVPGKLVACVVPIQNSYRMPMFYPRRLGQRPFRGHPFSRPTDFRFDRVYAIRHFFGLLTFYTVYTKYAISRHAAISNVFSVQNEFFRFLSRDLHLPVRRTRPPMTVVVGLSPEIPLHYTRTRFAGRRRWSNLVFRPSVFSPTIRFGMFAVGIMDAKTIAAFLSRLHNNIDSFYCNYDNYRSGDPIVNPFCTHRCSSFAHGLYKSAQGFRIERTRKSSKDVLISVSHVFGVSAV